MTDIESVIEAASLDEEFGVWSGQCLSIAKAIRDVFGGRILVVSEIPGEGFDHAVVEQDNRLFDGSGRVGWTETVTRFVDPVARREEVDAHFYQPAVPFETFSSAFNPDTYRAAKARLRDARELVESDS